MKLLLNLFLCIFGLAAMSFGADRDPTVLLQAERAFAKATAERGVDGWMEFMAPNAVELQCGAARRSRPDSRRHDQAVQAAGFQDHLGTDQSGVSGRGRRRLRGRTIRSSLHRRRRQAPSPQGHLSHHLAEANRRLVESCLRYWQPRSAVAN